MFCAHHTHNTKSVSLIFKEPNQFSMHCIKHKISIHSQETARERAGRCQDIHRSPCAPAAAEETQIQNWLLRPSQRSNFRNCPRSRVYVRSSKSNPRAERFRIGPYISYSSNFKGSLMFNIGGDPHSKSDSQACAAELFLPWPSIRGVQAVLKYKSALGKVLPMLRYPLCKCNT